MEPFQSVDQKTLNASLACIQHIADEGHASFRANFGILLGRTVKKTSPKEIALPNLVESIHFLAQTHSENLLASNTMVKAKGGLQTCITNLQIIKEYLKREEVPDDTEVKKLIDKIDLLTQNLEIKSRNRQHNELELHSSFFKKKEVGKIRYAREVVALVDKTDNVCSALWKLRYIRVKDQYLYFTNGLEKVIDDDSLELLLESSLERKNKSGVAILEDIIGIDLSNYPCLGTRAPSIVVKFLPILDRYQFCDDPINPRFLDFTVKVGDKEIQTNKALLMQESPIFKHMCAEALGPVLIKHFDVSDEIINIFLDVLIGRKDPKDLPLSTFCELLVCLDRFGCENFLNYIEQECDFHIVKQFYQKPAEEKMSLIVDLFYRINSAAGWNVLQIFLQCL